MKAKRLVEIRTERKMPQREVAAGCGVSQTVISQFERGRKIPEPAMIERLARALHCTVEDLEASPGSPIGPPAFRGGSTPDSAPLMRATPAGDE